MISAKGNVSLQRHREALLQLKDSSLFCTQRSLSMICAGKERVSAINNNRPGEAGAILQTPLSLIESHVTCQMSHVTCHMSHVTKVVKLIVGRSVINGAYPV